MLTARMDLLNLSPDDWVLDLGCGEGRHVHGVHMENKANVVGLDIDLPSLKKAIEGVEFLEENPNNATSFIAGSAYQLPFDDNTFDAIVCSEVLEHLDRYEDVLLEIRRVLKPDGRLCLSVPHAWPEKICWKLAPPPDGYPYQPGGHIRIFDDTHLRFEVERLGFKRTHKHHAHGLHPPLWWLKCMFWDRQDDHPLIKAYHSFLVWDIMKRPLLTRILEAVTAPFMGKSVVLYFSPNAADK